MEEEENNFQVKIKEVINCFTTPCIPPILDEKTIEDKDDCEILKALFDEFLKDSEIKEKDIYDEELTTEQREIILNIFQNNQIINITRYEIGHGKIGVSGETRERGFTYEIIGKLGLCLIYAGMKPKIGYTIEVNKIKIKEDRVVIYAYELEVGELIDAITYPFVEVVFYGKLPSNIEVILTPTGEILPKLN